MLDLYVFLIISTLLSFGQSWPSGAPDSTCNSLLPSHGSNRPKPASASPFTMTQMTIKAPQGISFKGLIVQAYDPSTNQPIGNFLTGRGLKPMDTCSGVTHTDRRGKRSAVLIWQAPRNQRGKVSFRATVVQRFSEYFYGLLSELETKA
ncbi:putative defense protein 3-like protein [Leptotrombidium deliense]|uniref:Putative defense protein 3-like protein n=1 Tax=Leptotrombidium deliense TaxID=299467 RepID=A0A443SFG2_9ACAR|nr:putative defense protein 3-like protein [Leptotrombidium deliense]